MDLFNVLLGDWADPLACARGSAFNSPVKYLSDKYSEKAKIYPKQADVFKAFKWVKPDNLKVVIIGMDPYPKPRQATGYILP
jgi:uracil DNA glycosylase